MGKATHLQMMVVRHGSSGYPYMANLQGLGVNLTKGKTDKAKLIKPIKTDKRNQIKGGLKE